MAFNFYEQELQKECGIRSFEITLPIETVSESNRTSEHWAKKHQRHSSQKKQIWVAFYNHKPQISTPCIITLTRLSPRTLDSDNLQSAFKWIRDAISEEILKDKKPGRSDDNPLFSWRYTQEKSKNKGIKIHIKFLS